MEIKPFLSLLGSTADFTIHRQADDGTLEELLPTTSVPFGGTSVDKDFEEFLEKIWGEGIVKSFAKINPENHAHMMKCFEERKMTYRLSDSVKRVSVSIYDFAKLVRETVGCPYKALQNSVYKDSVTLERFRLHFNTSVFNIFFQNAINGIIECLANILANKDFDDVSDILMVGGFSNSHIVQNALREKFKTRRFFITNEPGIADLIGAIYFCHLPKAIPRRAARYTYGVQICRKFKPKKDPENKKITIKGLEQCKDVLYPLVKRGQRIEPGCTFSVECVTILPNQESIQCGLYVSKSDNPQFVDQKDCTLLGKVTVQLPQGVSNAEIEETIIFCETQIIFRVREINTGEVYKTAIDILECKMSSEHLTGMFFLK